MSDWNDASTCLYFDKDEQPIALLKWAEMTRDWDYRTILSTKIAEGIVVDTVWNGFDPYFHTPQRSSAAPLLFATIVRVGDRVHEIEQFEHFSDCQRFHDRGVATMRELWQMHQSDESVEHLPEVEAFERARAALMRRVRGLGG